MDVGRVPAGMHDGSSIPGPGIYPAGDWPRTAPSLFARSPRAAAPDHRKRRSHRAVPPALHGGDTAQRFQHRCWHDRIPSSIERFALSWHSGAVSAEPANEFHRYRAGRGSRREITKPAGVGRLANDGAVLAASELVKPPTVVTTEVTCAGRRR